VSVAPGTKLGQYEVQDFIGQGAMGLVYRAYHTQLERIGAVKVMQAITPDADTVARFRHEAQAIAKLRHPNIVDVYDFGEFEGTPYMIVEYVPGGSLAGRMNRGKLDPATALKYLRGIAAGLDYAHAHGVVHRDVKPANVLLTEEGTPVLADFGLAKLLQGSSLKSMTGVTTGTPAYMAPEQVTGSRVGPASDRYSLATIAYEMLTGVIPFDGEALMELLYAQVHREPPVPSWRNSSLGPQVDAVIMRGLAKDPAARWESATAFVDALTSALRPRPAAAVTSTMVMSPPVASTVPLAAAAVAQRVEAEAETETEMSSLTTAYPSPPPYAPPRHKIRRSAIALVAAGLILLLALGGVVAWSLSHRPVTLSLSPGTVVAGDTVVVSANHLPPNEVGEVQLWSVLRRVAFRADGNGDVSASLGIPRDIELGDHHVRICWRGVCHAEQVLHVVSPAAFVTATPITSPSAASGPSATPSTTSSPRPGSTPTSSPTSTPKTSTSPSPVPSPARSLALSSSQIQILVGTMTVKGYHFAPGKTVALTFIQGSTTSAQVATGTVASDSTFYLNYKVPATAVVGSAYLRACDPIACAYATITVSAT